MSRVARAGAVSRPSMAISLPSAANENEAAAAQARVVRIDDTESQTGGDGRVDRVAAFLESSNARIGRQRMDRGDHAFRRGGGIGR